MTSLQPNRSHVLLTLGTLFAFGGASRFLPNGLAVAEETEPPAAAQVSQDDHSSEEITSDAVHDPDSGPREVCLTEDAAKKYSEDVWLFEAESAELRQKQVKLKAWEAELNLQTAELQDLQVLLEAQWNEMQQQADQDIVHLAKMYASMKAEQAAEIFDQMDPDFAAGFLTQLPSDQAGLILANMDNKKAYVVSVSMASANAQLRE